MLTSREATCSDCSPTAARTGQITMRLGISVHTVTTHIKNCYRKLDVHCAAAAVMRAIELRLLSVEH